MTVHCLVCNDICSGGLHFDTQSCSACAAFFRRTVAEGQQYSCRNSAPCNIVFGPNKYRKSCRSCRFEKCLAAGMRPEKVRNAWKSNRRQSEIVPKILKIEISDTDIGLNEISHIYLAHKQLRNQQYNFASNANVMNPPIATFHQLQMTNEYEPRIAMRFVKSCAAKTNFADSDRMALLKNFTPVSRVAEHSFMLAVQKDNRMLKRLIFIDGTFVPASLTGFTMLYEQYPPSANSPSFLARITMPCVDYQLNVLVPSVEDLNPDETECAALLNLILFDPDIPGLSLQGKKAVLHGRQQILHNLNEYYKHSGKDTAVRLGNLVLLLTPIKECANQRQEAFEIFRLAQAPILQNLRTTNENI